jgi:hypothetical protein
MATDTNVGKWDDWYADLAAPAAYADTETYRLGSDWLAGCALIGDWGCGKGWLRTLVAAGRYRGIDGSRTPFADEVADLASYRSETPGIFMRHVLEHDFRWRLILDNALASFTERMALILFTPLAAETHDMEWEDPPGVPNLAFRLADLTGPMDAAGLAYTHRTLPTAAKYGVETVFLLERP